MWHSRHRKIADRVHGLSRYEGTQRIAVARVAEGQYMSSLTMNGTTRSRTVLSLIAFFGASMACAQPTELPNRRDVLEGITTAGQPSHAALSAAAEAGYKSVIDLRAPNEDRGLDEKAAVESLGMYWKARCVSSAAEYASPCG